MHSVQETPLGPLDAVPNQEENVAAVVVSAVGSLERCLVLVVNDQESSLVLREVRGLDAVVGWLGFHVLIGSVELVLLLSCPFACDI